MSAQLERDVRFLKRYAVVSTLAFGVLALAAFRQEAAAPAQGQQKVKFTEIDVSESMLPEVKTHDRLSQVTDPAPLVFDGAGNLLPF